MIEDFNIDSHGFYLQNKVNFSFRVTSMEYIGDKIFVGSQQGGLYAYSQVNNRFKLIFCKTDAHPGSHVSLLQKTSSKKLISCGYYERRIILWKANHGFEKEGESKMFKTFIYQIKSSESNLFVGTFKKIYALDAITLIPRFKYSIQNSLSLDFLIASLSFFSTPDRNILIAGTDTYKRQNYFLALWEFPLENSEISIEVQRIPKVKQYSNIEDLDNFDLDGEVNQMQEDHFYPPTLKFQNPLLLEFSHSSRVKEIKSIPSLSRFVSLSFSEINIWEIQNSFCFPSNLSSLPQVQQIYSLKFGQEMNVQITLSFSLSFPIILIFLNSIVLAISASDGMLAFQGQLKTSSQNSIPTNSSSLQLSTNEILVPQRNNYSSSQIYSHPNHFILNNSAQISTTSLMVVRHLIERRSNQHFFEQIAPLKSCFNSRIEPIEEEQTEIQEEPPSNTQRNQTSKPFTSTAHLVPSTAQVTILQNQLKRLSQSKYPLKNSYLPHQMKTKSSSQIKPSANASNQSKNQHQGLMRSNSKSIKKQLKREIKFNNKRKKKFKNNILNNSLQIQLQTHQISSPVLNKNAKNGNSYYYKGNQNPSNKLNQSPRQMAIAAIQNKLSSHSSQKKSNNQNNQQQLFHLSQQNNNQQLNLPLQTQTKHSTKQPNVQNSSKNFNLNDSNIDPKKKQQFMQVIKQELSNTRLVALDSALQLGFWKFQ